MELRPGVCQVEFSAKWALRDSIQPPLHHSLPVFTTPTATTTLEWSTPWPNWPKQSTLRPADINRGGWPEIPAASVLTAPSSSTPTAVHEYPITDVNA